jgi:hypothetical protein
MTEDAILDALYDFGLSLAQAAPGSDDRVRGSVICGLVESHRQIRQQVAAAVEALSDDGGFSTSSEKVAAALAILAPKGTS